MFDHDHEDYDQDVRDLRLALGYTEQGDAGAADPPVNVRLIREDGTEVPLDFRYGGRDPFSGLHLWVVTAPAWAGDDQHISITADHMPSNASIAVRVRGYHVETQ